VLPWERRYVAPPFQAERVQVVDAEAIVNTEKVVGAENARFALKPRRVNETEECLPPFPISLAMIKAPGTLVNKSKPAPNRRIRHRNELIYIKLRRRLVCSFEMSKPGVGKNRLRLAKPGGHPEALGLPPDESGTALALTSWLHPELMPACRS
jgi:hypothetical protein